ncbi:MAG TPA: hypothetical protein VF556_01310 [Pyrinomonadaceae bacterium]
MIRLAAETDFKVLVIADKNIKYQQNKANLPLAILILSARNNRLESLLPLISEALGALGNIETGEIITIEN